LKEPLQHSSYPCKDCASTIPYHYCTACRAEWERREAAERDKLNAKQRRWYAQRKARQGRWLTCCVCGESLKGKRRDARYCSSACRQSAHRKAITSARSPPL
jgi:hypothetical protein